MGETDKAIAVLQYADTLLPASPVILTNLGNSYLDQGFIDEAETAYNQALEYDAQYSSAHHGLSVALVPMLAVQATLGRSPVQGCNQGQTSILDGDSNEVGACPIDKLLFFRK